jgi:glutaredoxin 3
MWFAPSSVRRPRDRGIFRARMPAAEVLVYTTDYCPYCIRAKALLAKKRVPFTEVNVEERPDLRSWLVSASGQRTVPQIFINNQAIGGFSEMASLEHRGELDRLLSEPRPPDLPALPR